MNRIALMWAFCLGEVRGVGRVIGCVRLAVTAGLLFMSLPANAAYIEECIQNGGMKACTVPKGSVFTVTGSFNKHVGAFACEIQSL